MDLCFGDTTQLTVSGGITYNWTTTTNISNTSSNNPDVWPTDTLMYFVSGTDANQCVNIDSITINVLDLPPVNAGGDRWLCPGDSIILFASGGVNYTWSPDSTLINSLTPNPTAFPIDNEELILLVEDQT